MTSGYTSNELYHFVGFRHPTDHESNYSILRKILSSKHIIYKGYSWGHGRSVSPDWTVDIVKGELIIPEVTCYCDIPLKEQAIHTAKYGKFGLGFARTFMIRKGARPVMYIPVRPTYRYTGYEASNTVRTIARWKKAWDFFNEFVYLPADANVQMIMPDEGPRSADEAIAIIGEMVMEEFFAYVKAFDCDLAADEKENYYMEREWRLLDKLSFLSSDIASVVVARAYVERFATDYPQFADRIQIAPE